MVTDPQHILHKAEAFDTNLAILPADCVAPECASAFQGWRPSCQIHSTAENDDYSAGFSEGEGSK